MGKLAAMLRGINVSGQKMINMKDLREMMTGLGLTDAQTYIQSGNIIFSDPDGRSEPALKKLLQESIQGRFGFDVPVIIRSFRELLQVQKMSASIISCDAEQLYVAFLDEKPDAQAVNAIDRQKYLPDSFVVEGREIYLCCPGGYGNTKLNNNFFEARLKTPATTRNLKTLAKLVELAGS